MAYIIQLATCIIHAVFVTGFFFSFKDLSRFFKVSQTIHADSVQVYFKSSSMPGEERLDYRSLPKEKMKTDEKV